jgi:hypothetical protein
MVETQSVREIRAKVTADELKSGVIVVSDPESERIVIFNEYCGACDSQGPVRFVPLPEHIKQSLLNGGIHRWDLINDTPDVALKGPGSIANWGGRKKY